MAVVRSECPRRQGFLAPDTRADQSAGTGAAHRRVVLEVARPNHRPAALQTCGGRSVITLAGLRNRGQSKMASGAFFARLVGKCTRPLLETAPSSRERIHNDVVERVSASQAARVRA